MMDLSKLEEQLAQLPLFGYFFIDPQELEFNQRIRWICENECPMYNKTWACPPAVGEVSACECKCKAFQNCLLIGTITECADVADINETLATRPAHEEITNQIRELFRKQGIEPYILSTEACAACEVCAWKEGKPCRFPERMHPCIESHGINLIPVLEEQGLTFQYGENIVTWFSLLFF